MFQNIDLIGVIVILSLLLPLLYVSGGMVLINDWLKARKERKKATAAAAESAGASPAPAAGPVASPA